MLHCSLLQRNCVRHRTQNEQQFCPSLPLKSFMAAMPGDEFVISFSTEFLGLSISLCKSKWVVKKLSNMLRALSAVQMKNQTEHTNRAVRQRKGKAEVDGIGSDLLISYFIVVPSARNSIHSKPLSTRMITYFKEYARTCHYII